ncbi:hypothetical protein RFI_22716 [Reticulomyxa filosa]|uniref:Kelch motif family protein n=1 Tax=Reticulomyxa filosa TaxID=46433 RepID=X6MLW6_RETFI|nr:hypothetical protein RFI_22716 [Reticulomyxa filosa]|eukprot:ETO14651.1 hypothetical protein RFI_22716 [Reticulomyxa filosa]
MSNHNTIQKAFEQTQYIISTPFQDLKNLPTPLDQPQCVLHKHEILICGSQSKGTCYSYHTIKNKYKFICTYPSDVYLEGHCVVKLVDKDKDRNEITLLSFGGCYKHTLMMKYVSVWSDENEMNELNNYNQWIPFTDNHNNPITIGRDDDYYWGVRAVIGGRNSNLLFITYLQHNISVFDLNTFQFIKHDTLPTNNINNLNIFSFIKRDPLQTSDNIYYHCFVSKSENEQEVITTNKENNKKKNYEMLLFCKDTGLSIEYDENNNTFQFRQLSVCDSIAQCKSYAYACVNDIILFFGGHYWEDHTNFVLKLVHKYSIQEDKWTSFKNTLSSPLCNCAAILSENSMYIHIIGGQNDEKITVSTHMKTKVRVWDDSQLSKNEIKFVIQWWIQTSKIKLGWIDDFDTIIFKYSITK